MRTQVAETSIDAFRSLGNGKIKTQADRIFDVIEKSTTVWAVNFSLNEIKALYRAMYGGDIELSTVSARVNGLVAARRLERVDSIRKCAVTGSGVRPVRIPETGQRALF